MESQWLPTTLMRMAVVTLSATVWISAQSAKQPPPAQKNATVRAGDEPQAKAKLYWDRRLSKCGDSYFDSTDAIDQRRVQRKGVSFYVRPLTLTPADRLNGYQWRGWIAMTASLYRDDGFGRLGMWQDGRTTPLKDGELVEGLSLGSEVVELMEKKQGLWTYSGRALENFKQSDSCEAFSQFLE